MLAPIRMIRLASALCAGAALVALAGCGGGKSSAGDGSAPAATAAAVSKYDSGPRAAETAVNQELAERGEELFKTKGCSACHAFGQKLSGPDLAGVSMRRTAAWMEQQILHPEVMTKEDPIAKELFAKFMLQMPNQGLSQAEALAVIEYLKHEDHESSGASQ
jgi:cytochrome c551/c552